MKYILPVLGIISAFVWCILLLNWQRDEIVSIKAQLATCQDFERDVNESNKNLIQCKNDVDYMKNSLEDLIYASEHGFK